MEDYLKQFKMYEDLYTIKKEGKIVTKFKVGDRVKVVLLEETHKNIRIKKSDYKKYENTVYLIRTVEYTNYNGTGVALYKVESFGNEDLRILHFPDYWLESTEEPLVLPERDKKITQEVVDYLKGIYGKDILTISINDSNYNNKYEFLFSDGTMTYEDINNFRCNRHINIFKCRDCKEWHKVDFDRTNNGQEYYISQKYCSNCYSPCPICGERVPHRETKHDKELNVNICMECHNKKWVTCSDCGVEFKKEDARRINDEGRRYNRNSYAFTGWVCSHCITNYTECGACGKLFNNSVNTFVTRDDGMVLCGKCNEMLRMNDGRIFGYHEYQCWLKHGTDTDLRYGFELEVERENSTVDTDDMARQVVFIMDKKVSCSYDGSIDNGFEIVSQPMTYKYMTEETTKKQLTDMLDTLAKAGYRSHQPRTCGLHFHITKSALKSDINTIDDTIDNILMIFENFQEEMTIFSRRTSNQINHWTNFLTSGGRTIHGVVDLEYIKKEKGSNGRYMAVNLTNSKTIEFRIFRGTLNSTTFMATVELVNQIVEYSRNHKDIKGLTWETLLGDNETLNHYSKKVRGIESTIVCDGNLVLKNDKPLKAKRTSQQDGQTVLSRRSSEVSSTLRGIRMVDDAPLEPTYINNEVEPRPDCFIQQGVLYVSDDEGNYVDIRTVDVGDITDIGYLRIEDL